MYCDINKNAVPARETLTSGMCPVRWALDCVSAAREGSCGKNVMCRDGMTQLRSILSDIISGSAEDGDLELIRDVCGVIATTPGCELATLAADNVLWCMDTYAAEFSNHLRRRCAALECFYDVIVLPELCTGCGKCPGICPEGAIAGGSGLISVVKAFKCTHCGACLTACPQNAVVKAGAVKPALPAAPVPVGSFAAAGGRRRRRDAEPAAPAVFSPAPDSRVPSVPVPASEPQTPRTPFVPAVNPDGPVHRRRRRGGSPETEE